MPDQYEPDLYDGLASLNIGEVPKSYFPGANESSRPIREETPLVHLMTSGMAHRITDRREMARLMVKKQPYSGRTKKQSKSSS